MLDVWNGYLRARAIVRTVVHAQIKIMVHITLSCASGTHFPNKILYCHFLNSILREGMWSRCFPAMKKLRSLIAEGAIGRPVVVSGDFGWNTKDCDDHRIWLPSSGGMINDVAMYMAQLGLAVFDGDSFRDAVAIGNTKDGVDLTTLVNCRFEKNLNGFLQFFVTGEANT